MGIFNKKKNNDEIYYYQADDDNFEDGSSVDWDEIYDKKIKERNKKKTKDKDWNPTYNYEQDNKSYKGKSFIKNSSEDNESFSANKQSEDGESSQSVKKYIFIVVAVFYLIYIGAGVISTYSNDNKKTQVVNINLIEKRTSYSIAKKDYDRLSQIEVTIQVIDKAVSHADNTKAYNYSVEYNKMGDIIDKGILEMKGSEYGDNAPIQTLGLKIYDELGQYITLMTKALSNTDQSSYNSAIVIRDQAYSDYSQYSEFIKQLATDAQIN